MAKLMGVAVMSCLALVLSMSFFTSVNGIDCGSVLSSMFPCSSYLGSYLPIAPGVQCCDGVGTVVQTADTESLCRCFSLNPLAPGFIPSKAQQLPNLCNLTSFLPLVNCLIPSANNLIPFPPLLFPIPPVLQTPFIPIPGIPNPPVDISADSPTPA